MQIKEPDLEVDYKGKKHVIPLGNGLPKPQKEYGATWMKPEQGWHKLNVDASYIQNESKGAWGAVLRNDAGNVIISAWGVIPRCLSAEVAEAIAVKEGLRLIIPMESTPVVIESNNSLVVSELNYLSDSRSQVCFIVSEAKDMLKMLQDYKIQKVNRAANKVAHELASFGRSEWSDGVLVGSAPPCALVAAQKDCIEGCILKKKSM